MRRGMARLRTGCNARSISFRVERSSNILVEQVIAMDRIETHTSRKGVGLLKDPSAVSLIAANLFTIGVALYQRWDLLTLMWVYWGQSVVIGGVNFWRMWTLKEFSTEGLRSGGKPVPETEKGKRSTALFFAIHYGGFHAGYLVFLLVGTTEMKSAAVLENVRLIVLCVVGFLATHVYSFLYNRERDRGKVPNIGNMMFFPYVRIIPMHLTIIFGFAFMVWGIFPHAALLMFLVLKLVADLIMHAVEHRDFETEGRKAGPAAQAEIEAEQG